MGLYSGFLEDNKKGRHGHGDACYFADAPSLTTFANYCVLQLLHNLGVLRYGWELALAVNKGEELGAGSDDEMY